MKRVEKIFFMEGIVEMATFGDKVVFWSKLRYLFLFFDDSGGHMTVNL